MKDLYIIQSSHGVNDELDMFRHYEEIIQNIKLKTIILEEVIKGTCEKDIFYFSDSMNHEGIEFMSKLHKNSKRLIKIDHFTPNQLRTIMSSLFPSEYGVIDIINGNVQEYSATNTYDIAMTVSTLIKAEMQDKDIHYCLTEHDGHYKMSLDERDLTVYKNLLEKSGQQNVLFMGLNHQLTTLRDCNYFKMFEVRIIGASPNFELIGILPENIRDHIDMALQCYNATRDIKTINNIKPC